MVLCCYGHVCDWCCVAMGMCVIGCYGHVCEWCCVSMDMCVNGVVLLWMCKL